MGGVVSALLNSIRANRSARRQREVAWLQEQLRSLYGPLSFFTSQNEQLFKLSDDVRDAYSAHFTGKWSEDDQTQSTLRAQVESTITLGNMYIERVVENNSRLIAILEKNWHLADPPDATVFSQFQVDQTRFVAQVKQEGDKKVPFQIIQALGEIPFMRPDMIDCVRAAIKRKQDRLEKLGASSTEGSA